MSAPVIAADHVSKWYGQVSGLNDVTAEAVDDRTARFTFAEPRYQQWSNWVYFNPIVPKHLWEKKSEKDVTAGANETSSVSMLAYNNLIKGLNLGIGSTMSVLIFLTVAIIAICCAAYFLFERGLWDLGDTGNERVFEYGAIPYEVTNPGDGCGVTVDGTSLRFSDANAGTLSAPLRTIQRAVDLAPHVGPARGDTATLLLDLQVHLTAEDRHVPRRLDPDPDLLAHDRQHRDLDVVTDHDGLIRLAR